MHASNTKAKKQEKNKKYFGFVTSSLMMKVTVAGLIHSRAWIPPSIKIAGFGEPKIYIEDLNLELDRN